MDQGSVGEFNAFRQFVSRFATTLSRVILKRTVLDPLSGYFMLTRELFYQTVRHLSGKGFKILLDILASSPEETKMKEVPFTFRSRQWGKSKLDSVVVWEFLVLIFDKLVGGVIPAYLIFFAAVINYMVAMYLKDNLTDKSISWNIGGWIGVILAGIFNYSTTSIFTWNRDIKKKQR